MRISRFYTRRLDGSGHRRKAQGFARPYRCRHNGLERPDGRSSGKTSLRYTQLKPQSPPRARSQSSAAATAQRQSKTWFADKMTHIHRRRAADLEGKAARPCMPGRQRIKMDKSKRKTVIAGNWKMNTAPTEARKLACELAEALSAPYAGSVELWYAFLSTYLPYRRCFRVHR